MMKQKTNTSSHHLFSYYEIRAKLIQIHGLPNSDEQHVFMQNESKRIHDLMPRFNICNDLHKKIHKNDIGGISNIFNRSKEQQNKGFKQLTLSQCLLLADELVNCTTLEDVQSFQISNNLTNDHIRVLRYLRLMLMNKKVMKQNIMN